MTRLPAVSRQSRQNARAIVRKLIRDHGHTPFAAQNILAVNLADDALNGEAPHPDYLYAYAIARRAAEVHAAGAMARLRTLEGAA